jgi:hypothetical protein
MTCRHFTLFTLRSGQSGLEIYTTRRDAAHSALGGRSPQQRLNELLC